MLAEVTAWFGPLLWGVTLPPTFGVARVEDPPARGFRLRTASPRRVGGQARTRTKPHSRHGEQLPQQTGVFFQPMPGHPVIGTNALYFPPEPGRVVHLPQMHQFVQTNVIAYESGCLDEPPVQGNRAASRTGAPTRFLAAHRDATYGQSVPGGQLQYARWQFPRCQSAKMAFDGRAQIGGRIWAPDRLAAEADGFSFAVGPGFNADRVAAQEDIRPNIPDRRFPGLGLKPLKLAFKPCGMAFDKLPGHRRRAAAGNCNAGDAIGTQPEQIAACPRIAHHQEGQLLRPHRQVDNR